MTKIFHYVAERSAGHGILLRRTPNCIEYQNDSATTLLDQLGGECGGGNWTYPIDEHFDLRYINADRDDQEVHIYDRDGNRYYFIAAVAGWEYCSHGADWILMY